MINRCIEESGTFGIVLIPPGTAAENETTIRRVGVTLRIVQFDRIEDGRINILAAGEMRFRILKFTAGEPYWSATVEFFDDDSEVSAELQESYAELVRLYREAHRLAAQLRGVEVQEIKIPESPASLSFMVSYVLDIAPETKQSFLEMTSTTERLKILEVHLEETVERLIAQIAQDKIRHKVRGNGHYTPGNN